MENGTIAYENDMPKQQNVQQMMMGYIGKYVICELLIGLRSMSVREGVLIEVGQNYFILQNPNNGDHTSCDLYSLKFLTVPASGQKTSPYCPYYTHGQQGNCATPGGTMAQNTCWIRVD